MNQQLSKEETQMMKRGLTSPVYQKYINLKNNIISFFNLEDHQIFKT